MTLCGITNMPLRDEEQVKVVLLKRKLPHSRYGILPSPQTYSQGGMMVRPDNVWDTYLPPVEGTITFHGITNIVPNRTTSILEDHFGIPVQDIVTIVENGSAPYGRQNHYDVFGVNQQRMSILGLEAGTTSSTIKLEEVLVALGFTPAENELHFRGYTFTRQDGDTQMITTPTGENYLIPNTRRNSARKVLTSFGRISGYWLGYEEKAWPKIHELSQLSGMVYSVDTFNKIKETINTDEEMASFRKKIDKLENKVNYLLDMVNETATEEDKELLEEELAHEVGYHAFHYAKGRASEAYVGAGEELIEPVIMESLLIQLGRWYTPAIGDRHEYSEKATLKMVNKIAGNRLENEKR